MEFRWNEWNLEHVPRHGVTPAEAEWVVRTARRAFPRTIHDDKRLVWGPDSGGRLVQVIFVLDPDDTVYVIHGRPLTGHEIRRYRRQAMP
jgi:uncharacterized DUF497 family protein